MSKLVVACIQTSAGPEIAPNLTQIEPLIRQAHAGGAQFMALPENVSLMIRGRENILARAGTEAAHPAIPFFSRMAKETGAWIMCGSLAVAYGDGRMANRAYLFDPEGKIAARYDKIHMFDADLGGGECYRESASYHPGEQAVVADLPWGRLGMTICYDMRFPYLYRALAKAGAILITVPAAFTVPTGQAHWHVLLRSRAIETGAYVIAPAQCGEHEGGRRTFGHSLIVDPWGKILAEAADEPGVLLTELNLDMVAEARCRLPCLQHDRIFQGP